MTRAHAPITIKTAHWAGTNQFMMVISNLYTEKDPAVGDPTTPQDGFKKNKKCPW